MAGPSPDWATPALTVSGVALLVSDVVVGRGAGIVTAGFALLAFVILWYAVPPVQGRRDERRNPPPSEWEDTNRGEARP